MLLTVKRSSLALSQHLGLTRRLAASSWRRERLLVLCYHGVSMDDEHEWNPALHVSPETFTRRLELLDRHACTLLPLEDAIARLYEGTLPDRAVALTFDDGYHDFAARAWPALQRHGFPATVYLTTLRCEHNTPVPHLFLSYLLWKRRDRSLDARGIAGFDRVYPLGSPGERRAVVADFSAHIVRAGFGLADKDALTREIAGRLALDYDALFAARILRLMTPAEVTDLSARGVDFELHTHCHRTPEDPDLFVTEIRENRKRLERMTGRAARHFCYPSGVYRPSYLPKLRAEGILSATTCDPDLASQTSERLLLPRFVDTNSISEVEFEAWITGAACWLPRRTRKARIAH